MKALELKVYPKMGSVYYDDEANCTWSETMVYGLSVEKRLTDAELAAEFHAQQVRVQIIEDGSPHSSAGPTAYLKLTALHRFATLPHHDDPTETGTQA